ncbi:MAG: choice-of-anchor B family protein [Massilia sp.]|nr:choice-of-anchor B family protein [Massilia sp.]
MKRTDTFARAALRGGALLVLCTLGLVSCGGGGSPAAPGTPTPAPAPPVTPPVTPPTATGDFGGGALATVARAGVAGTWGYTAPDGARYALMGTAKGVLVLDLRDTKNPRVVDEIDGPTNTTLPGIYWREMRVYGSHAYIVSEHTNFRGGIMILDLSGLPASVRFVKSVTPRDGFLPAHTLDIDTARGLLYLQRRNSSPALAPDPFFDRGRSADGGEKGEHEELLPSQGAIEIWDIKTDPVSPRYLTTFHQNVSVHDMTAAGDVLWVAEGEASSFSAWDVKDPLNPKLALRWPVEAGHYAHNIWPSGDGTFVVTTEELPNGLPARVWKLNGSAAPTQLSSFKVGTGTPHNVVMEGRMAYLSHYSEGAAVVDLSDPAAPKTMLRVDTNSQTGPALNGCWGVYKFPGAPLMMCSDISTGFHLIGIDPK